jgi:hypothetical protein
MRSAAVLLRSALLLGGALAAGCGGGKAVVVRGVEGAPPEFLVASADTALADGDVEAARRLLSRAQEEAPESAYVYVAWGRYHTAVRRYKDAKDALERAAALAPRNPEPAYWLGRAYQQAGDLRMAAESYSRSLALDPGYRAASDALAPILGARYEAAGIPGDYSLLRTRTTVCRGELAVILAVELGADPDRAVWRSDASPSGEGSEFEVAWGSRWAKAAAARGWVGPFPDGSYRLGDPVTRAALALIVARVERRWDAGAPPDTTTPRAFPDLNSRHYLARAAAVATAAGLPTRGEDGRFEPWAAASGAEVLLTVRGVARLLGATPVVSAEPR